MDPLAIVGYMGSGKTTVGRLAARRMGRPFVDLDREISVRAGRSIPEIFAEGGEPSFRDLEHTCLRLVLEGGGEPVVACGGGVVLRRENRALLAGVPTVFLEEDPLVLYGRTRGGSRPLRGADPESFSRRYRERLPLYREVADLTVRVGGRPAERVAEEVVGWASR